MNLLNLIFLTFYFALPAYLANMAPVIFMRLKWLKCLNKTIDGGKKIGQHFIFGSSKTWRGIVSAIILGVVVAYGQSLLQRYYFFQQLSLLDYGKYWLLFGFLAGLGAILGDLFKSFIKRRMGISSGGSWPVFDQLDFIFGFLILTCLLVRPPLDVVFTLVFITLILHPLTNIIAYFLKIKKVWW